jgi:oligopeptide/dipeptide ABC transporter ATP-binding protein
MALAQTASLALDAPPSERSAVAEPLLRVSDLRIEFATDDGAVSAIDGVSFDVAEGRCLGIVGESGCGKSVTSLAVMGLLPRASGRITGGSIQFAGRDMLTLGAHEMRSMRGREISMIFQEPMSSLNPAFTIGDQIVECLLTHERIGAAAAGKRALELLRLVRIPAPAARMREYPHRLSGGMRQRVMIAMAIACRPRLLIADEPTTALDVTIQAQIIDLLRMLKEETGTAIILISHDLGVVAELADEVAVMYAGRIVERARADRLFDHPEHPYTIGLLGAIPRLGNAGDPLVSIEGMLPDPSSRPPGCSFEQRCPFRRSRCAKEAPRLGPAGPGHLVACWSAPLE